MSVNSHSPKNTKSLALLFLGVGLILLGLASALLIPRAEAITSGEDDPAETGGLSAIPVEVSFPAPDLRLSDLSGQSFALSDFAGQMVLVNNWAIWCPPCKAELPDLNAFYLKYKAQGFVIVAIEAGSPQADVQTFIDQAGLAFPTLEKQRRDTLDDVNTAADAWVRALGGAAGALGLGLIGALAFLRRTWRTSDSRLQSLELLTGVIKEQATADPELVALVDRIRTTGRGTRGGQYLSEFLDEKRHLKVKVEGAQER